MLTAGCNAITANETRVRAMTMKETLGLQSRPEGLNQMNRIPENVNTGSSIQLTQQVKKYT